jgi:hypothetical protein
VKVQWLVSLTGTVNNRPGPFPRGSTTDLDDEAGRKYVAGGPAIEVQGRPLPIEQLPPHIAHRPNRFKGVHTSWR